MDTKIIIIIITSISSLFIAVFSLIQSILSSKNNLNTLKMIEELKYSMENRKDVKKYQEEKLSRRIDGLDATIKEIQILKDKLLIIISSGKNGLLSDEVISFCIKSRESLFNCYESFLSDLDKNDAEFIHKAKNLSLNIENTMKNILADLKYIDLSDAQRNILQDFKNRLNDIQLEIRNIKSDIIFNFTKNYGY